VSTLACDGLILELLAGIVRNKARLNGSRMTSCSSGPATASVSIGHDGISPREFQCGQDARFDDR
jgi:hypothetical protein